MSTQRQKDEDAAWTQTDMQQRPAAIFADGATYARKQVATQLRQLTADYVYWPNALDKLIRELEAS